MWGTSGKHQFVSYACVCVTCVSMDACTATDGVCLRLWPGLWWLPFIPTVLSQEQHTHTHTRHCRGSQSVVSNLSEVKGCKVENNCSVYLWLNLLQHCWLSALPSTDLNLLILKLDPLLHERLFICTSSVVISIVKRQRVLWTYFKYGIETATWNGSHIYWF